MSWLLRTASQLGGRLKAIPSRRYLRSPLLAPGKKPGQGRGLETYLTSAPSPQNALDLFEGEWSSRLPEPFADLKAGSSPLFADHRIDWLASEIGGFAGRTVLELGPLEAGHTYMLERGGAGRIDAIESNTHAYLKCLIVKEVLGLQRAHFHCGDFVEYLKADGPRFDLGIASGVLYHMRDPVQLIALLARRCGGSLFLWTHYYDRELIAANPALAAKHTGSFRGRHDGFEYVLSRYEYRAALDWGGFCGGSAPYAHWMSRPDILKCLEHFGFGDIRINFDHVCHPNGPALALIAKRR